MLLLPTSDSVCVWLEIWLKLDMVHFMRLYLLISSPQLLTWEAKDEEFAVSHLLSGLIYSEWLLLQNGLDTCHKWKEEILCWIKHKGRLDSRLCCKLCVTEEKSSQLYLTPSSQYYSIVSSILCSYSCCVFSLFPTVRFGIIAGLMVLNLEGPRSLSVQRCALY